MTPTAVTPAGRAAARPTHRRRVPSRTAPSAPRRVSGPLRGRIAQPERAPSVRRPARPARPARAARRPHTVRFAEFVRALPDHSLLDRVVRGRTWIALLGVMLVGIVAMQVEVLKLGASEGRALTESSALQSRNEILRAAVASDSSEPRIERLAAGYGMVMPNPVDDVFLSPNATANANRAAHNISAPDPTGFIASLPEDQQALDASATDPATTDPGTTDTGTTAAGTTDATDTTPTTPAGDTTGTDTTDAGDTSDNGAEGTTTQTTDPTGGGTTVTPVTPTAPTTTDSGTSPGTDTGEADAAGGASLAAGTPAG